MTDPIDALNGRGIGLAGSVFVTDERRTEDKIYMLGLWLEIAVPLWIHRYRSEDWTREQRMERAPVRVARELELGGA